MKAWLLGPKGIELELGIGIYWCIIGIVRYKYEFISAKDEILQKHVWKSSPASYPVFEIVCNYKKWAVETGWDVQN